jgi:hypothetical protein
MDAGMPMPALFSSMPMPSYAQTSTLFRAEERKELFSIKTLIWVR